MGKIRTGCVFCLVAVLLGVLTSCGGGRIPWDYRDHSFRAEIQWQSSVGIALTGELQVAKGDFPRDVTLRFLSPETMAGITLTRKDGVTSVALDGMKMEGAEVGDLLSVIDLLLPEGEMRAVTTTDRQGERVLYAEVIEIKEEEERIYEIYLEEKTGIPREIRVGERSVTLTSFEVLE